MAKEILAIPEEKLKEVIKVIKAGLKTTKVSREVQANLKKWCKEEEEYLKDMEE